jgi:endonuclease YncB( thermonuclease family)
MKLCFSTAFIFCASLLAQLGHAETLTGKVVAITDGDTVTVLDANKTQHKIRLAGIDAPEKKQAFGNTSKDRLSDCAYNKEVNVEWDKVDRYGRKVGKIIVNGVDCNLRQIKLGMAWHYKKYESEQSADDRTNYAAAETAVKASRTGLWSEANPVAPWDFRQQARNQ